VIAAILLAAILLMWVLIPSGGQQAIAPYHGQVTAGANTSYTPPDPVVPKNTAPEKKDSPPKDPPRLPNPVADKPGVYTYNSSSLPAYLKKLQAKTEAAATQVSSNDGGIDFKPVTYAGTKSFTIPHRDYMLMRWSTIVCILDTEIVTGAGGETPFRCHTKHDTLSPTGVVLMEAGTIVGGTYKSLVADGDSRVIAITAEAQTPNGVIADIGGPIADGLGAAGVPGSVDNHWMQRIGGALLLSLIDNGFQLLQSEIQKNSQNTNINLGGGGAGGLNTVGEEMLKKTINIPPTITLNQGTEIVLWVTKFIDFSASYKLEAK